MKKQILFFSVLTVIALFFSACEKTVEPVEDIDHTMVTEEDLTTAEDLVEDTESLVEDIVSSRDFDTECPSVTVEHEVEGEEFPKTVTIDFGEACEGPNGRVRSGQIIVYQTGKLRLPGTSRTTTFQDFFIDEVQKIGTLTKQNNTDDAGNFSFTHTTEITMIFPNPDGDEPIQTSWYATRTKTQVAGADTPLFIWDNIFEITGQSNGVNRKGDQFSSEILEGHPLVRRLNCRWLVSGIQETTTTPTDGEARTRSIDYGDGTCDRIATVTFADGETKEIKIRPWWRH